MTHNEPDHFPDARKMVDLAARIETAEGPDRARQKMTADDWQQMAAIMWRWPSMGVCTAADIQPFIAAAALRARSAS